MNPTVNDLRQALDAILDEMDEWGVILTRDCYERIVEVECDISWVS